MGVLSRTGRTLQPRPREGKRRVQGGLSPSKAGVCFCVWRRHGGFDPPEDGHGAPLSPPILPLPLSLPWGSQTLCQPHKSPSPTSPSPLAPDSGSPPHGQLAGLSCLSFLICKTYTNSAHLWPWRSPLKPRSRPGNRQALSLSAVRGRRAATLLPPHLPCSQPPGGVCSALGLRQCRVGSAPFLAGAPSAPGGADPSQVPGPHRG